MSFDIFLLHLVLSGRLDWLLRRLRLLRLTPFQPRLPRGHLKPTSARRVLRNLLLFFTPLSASRLATRHKKQKDVFRHLLASLGFVGMTGFEGRSRKLRPRGDNQNKAQAESRAIEITLSPQPYIKEYQPPHRKSRWHAWRARFFCCFAVGLHTTQ